MDIVFIGGDPLPGKCTPKGIAQLEVDKKKAKGTNGVTLTVTGYQPGLFEVEVLTWTDEQDQFFQAWLDKFWITPQKQNPVGGRAPQVAVAIDHPRLAKIGITTCIVQGVSIPEPGPVEGTEITRLKLIDGRANEKKTVVKTARGASTNVPLAKRLHPGEKESTPAKPSSERDDLGPKGPRSAPAGGSD